LRVEGHRLLELLSGQIRFFNECSSKEVVRYRVSGLFPDCFLITPDVLLTALPGTTNVLQQATSLYRTWLLLAQNLQSGLCVLQLAGINQRSERTQLLHSNGLDVAVYVVLCVIAATAAQSNSQRED